MMLLPRDRIGIVADSDEIHCALVRAGKVTWSVTLPVSSDGLVATVEAVVRDIPRASRRPIAVIALGPHWSQLRRVRDLPPIRNDRIMREVISQSASRFFLKNGVPLATTGVAWTGDREGWSAAFEQPLVSALCMACSTVRLRVGAIVPLTGFTDRTASSIAGLGLQHPLAYRPPETASPVSVVQLLTATAALSLAALVALAAPALAATVQLLRAERALAALEPQRAKFTADERELRELGTAHHEIAGFFARARSQTVFVAGFAEVLPEGAFLTSMRTDSSGGTAVLLADRADEAMRAIEAIAEVGTVEIVGPIARESVQNEPRERVTLRFSWRRADSRTPSHLLKLAGR